MLKWKKLINQKGFYMKFLDRVVAKLKQRHRNRAEARERTKVLLFMLELQYKPIGSKIWPANLTRRDERIEYKNKLTSSYNYRRKDDVLAKKQDFIDKYTIHEQQQFRHFTNSTDEYVSEYRIRAWRNHEQVERARAQRAWHTVVKRNSHNHVNRQIISNQNQR